MYTRMAWILSQQDPFCVFMLAVLTADKFNGLLLLVRSQWIGLKESTLVGYNQLTKNGLSLEASSIIHDYYMSQICTLNSTKYKKK
ncbi:hypothetical protein KEM48_010449 [Puccinia striiformis f. sp. tritici PST-130]|nr:hypothetical protein H4Q26_010907 [Puccinia striiformis f. sp. tritici PST-130]KAI9626389.1 hypothetical protein KEM48_010449 [Puccinia striiformis f. sp. tritici PST-130]